MPVLPMLIGDFTANRELQSYWYGALMIVYGVMQFGCAPLLGALSDRFGRRPVILASIFGLGLHYLLLALAPSLWFMLLARVIGGITGASFSVASAYASDVTSAKGRARSFGLIGAAFGLGFIFGPMLGGILGSIDLHLPFYVAAGLGLRADGAGAVDPADDMGVIHALPLRLGPPRERLRAVLCGRGGSGRARGTARSDAAQARRRLALARRPYCRRARARRR